MSAGSANLVSYMAGQRGRNYQFYTEYAFRKQYMSRGNFITKRSYVDMDYVYGTLCNSGGEYPLDYSALRDDPMEFYVVAADALTGDPVPMEKAFQLGCDRVIVILTKPEHLRELHLGAEKAFCWRRS